MEIKDFDREYKQSGSYHHRLKGFKALWYKRNYELLSRDVRGKVLDMACGDGRLSDFLDKSGTELDGFDLSEKAIRLAQEKKSYARLWLGDIKDERNYAKNDYDFFICSLSLQYLSEKDLISHFKFIGSALSGRKTYRFSFPNSANVLSPVKLRTVLSPIFKKVELITITGFVENADALEKDKLEPKFLDSISCPPEKSYHYMVELKN